MQIIVILFSLVFGPASFITSILLCFFYLKLKKLRSQSSTIIICLCIGQCFFDIDWVISYNPILVRVPSIVCMSLSSIVTYGLITICFYNFALSYVVYVSVCKMRINSIRTKIIHIGINLVSTFIIVLLNILQFPNPRQDHLGCFLPKDNIAVILNIVLLIFLILSLFLSIYVYCVGNTKKMIYHLIITFIYALTLIPIIIYKSYSIYEKEHDIRLQYVIYRQIFIIPASLTGVLIFAVRLCDPKFRKMITEYFWRSEQDDQSNIEFGRAFSMTNSFSSESSYDYLLQHIQHDVIYTQNVLAILTTLSYVYQNLGQPPKSELTYRRWQPSVDQWQNETARVEELFYQDFQRLREFENLDNAQVIHSLNPQGNMLNLLSRTTNPGGSGEGFIFFTFDHQLIIKSVNKSELKAFKKLFPQYYSNIISGDKSFLARIYGVYKIKVSGGKVACIIFQNILSNTHNAKKFDLKGSSANRNVTNEIYQNFDEIPSDIVFKDSDFTINVGKIKLLNKQALVRSLMKDAKILQSLDIMDYSLFLGIQEIDTDLQLDSPKKYRTIGEIGGTYYYVYMAIIDYFQLFNFQKKAELRIKSLKHVSKEISSIPAKPYLVRFSNNLNIIFS